MDARLLRALTEIGFTEATEVQAKAIPPALNGKDLMVAAKTGSGKTAAFLLPLLSKLLSRSAPKSGTRALILLPTRELALQTQKTFEKLAAYTYIKSGLVIGGEAFKHQIASLRRNPEVLIATPGRLVEHLDKNIIDLNDIEVLVLDEADRMLDMGFTENMQRILGVCKQQRQNLLYSATLNHKGMKVLQDSFEKPQTIVVDTHQQGHSNICQQIVLADDIRHKQTLVPAIINVEKATKTLIFCNTRAQCQQLSNLLQSKKLRVAYIHGEVEQSNRKQVLNRFRTGSLDVLVATDVAARGLDIEDVALVINYTVAHSGDEHVHRVGRTGRASHLGKAITLVCANEWNVMSSIERYLKIRFELRSIEGFKAKYTGPKKIKNSGKAASTKKRKNSTGSGAKKSKSKPIAKTAKKPIGKKPANKSPRAEDGKKAVSKPAPATQNSPVGDGYSAFKKRK